MLPFHISFFFFFNDTATTEIYTLSLHDALPIFQQVGPDRRGPVDDLGQARQVGRLGARDRKSTRLNSSHSQISYAVFCLKKKKHADPQRTRNVRTCVVEGAHHPTR